MTFLLFYSLLLLFSHPYIAFSNPLWSKELHPFLYIHSNFYRLQYPELPAISELASLALVRKRIYWTQKSDVRTVSKTEQLSFLTSRWNKYQIEKNIMGNAVIDAFNREVLNCIFGPSEELLSPSSPSFQDKNNYESTFLQVLVQRVRNTSTSLTLLPNHTWL